MLDERSQLRLFRAFPAMVLLLVAHTCVAQDPIGSRYAISEADIARELNTVGIKVIPSQVHLAVHMSAVVESPKLEVVTAKLMGDKRVSVELRCSAAAECLPFFAALDTDNAKLFVTEIQTKRPTTAAGPDVISEVGVGPMTQTKLRVGSRATLIIRDGQMDIHLQVLAIDTGAVGQQVRVCTLDRKKVFRATVTGEGTITGVLE